MRVSTFAIFGLFTSALAMPAPAAAGEVSKRQLLSDTTVVDNAIAAIKKGTLDLDSSIKAINSDDLEKLLALDTKAQALNKVLVSQTKKVAASPAIGLFSALPIAAKAQDLINTVKDTLTDLKSVKKYTDAQGVSSIVVGDLQLLQKSADKFVTALKAKVPSIAQFIADLDKKQLDTAFTDAIKYFQGKSS